MPDPDDQTWFHDALARLEGPLTRYARGFTRDTERARDVVQDTFLRLLRQERAAVEGHLTEWLYTVCRNRALDVCRKEGRMTTTDETGFVGLVAKEPDPGAVLERRETTGQVLQLLERLPEKQREVIRLKFSGGLSYKEISRITNHSVSYVGVLIHTGMKTLRNSVAALQPEAGGSKS
ncbi:MAG: RNA polymerase sigma factor (sigma-70 family) [Pseudohongiellaceae bacterium]